MFFAKRHTGPRKSIKFGGLLLIVGAGSLGLMLRADTPPSGAGQNRDAARMVEADRRVEAASGSDADRQLLHEKHCMSHKMQSIFATKFAGTALTMLRKREENNDPNALSDMLSAIDSGGPGSVYIIKVEDGEDIAGGMNAPIDGSGSRVYPNDMIVAEQDGVVVVPKVQAAKVIILAQKLDYSEYSMYPHIERFHSIVEAVKQFGRI